MGQAMGPQPPTQPQQTSRLPWSGSGLRWRPGFGQVGLPGQRPHGSQGGEDGGKAEVCGRPLGRAVKAKATAAVSAPSGERPTLPSAMEQAARPMRPPFRLWGC